MSTDPADDETVIVRAPKPSVPEVDDATVLSKRKVSPVQEPQLVSAFVEEEENAEDVTVIVTRPLGEHPSLEDDDSTVLVSRAPLPEPEDDATTISHRNKQEDESDDSTRIVTRPGAALDDSTRISSRNIGVSETDDSTRIVHRDPDKTAQSARNVGAASQGQPRAVQSDVQKKFFKEPEVKVGTSQVFTRGAELPQDDIDREDFSWSEDERILSLAELTEQRTKTLKKKKNRGLRLVGFVVLSVIAIGSAVALTIFLLSV